MSKMVDLTTTKELAPEQIPELTAEQILNAIQGMDPDQIRKICEKGAKAALQKEAKKKVNVIVDVILSDDSMSTILGTKKYSVDVIRFAFESLFTSTMVCDGDAKSTWSEYISQKCEEKYAVAEAKRAKRREKYGATKSAAISPVSNDKRSGSKRDNSVKTTSQQTTNNMTNDMASSDVSNTTKPEANPNKKAMTVDDVANMFVKSHPDATKDIALRLVNTACTQGLTMVDEILEKANELYNAD